MDAYNKAKAIAEDNIGIDFNRKEFRKSVDSIDFRIIDTEIERMYHAGQDVAKICPNESLWQTFKNMIVTPNYGKRVSAIMDYAENLKPSLVNRYAIEIVHPKDFCTVELDADTVITDLHNAFNHGVFDRYMDKSKNFFFIFSQKRVVKKVA